MKKLKILGVYANEGGCAYYRLIMPLQKIAEKFSDQVEVQFSQNPLNLNEKTGEMPPDEADYPLLDWADIVLINNISNFGGPYTARVIGLAKQRGKFVHFDTDDLLIDLYDGHRLKQVYEEKNLYDITKWMYQTADLVTVTQKKFAERVKPYVGGVLAVVKNSIDYNLPCWNMQRIKVKKITRVGWAGGIHHEEDVKEFSGVPWSVNQKVGKERVQWDFYGAPQPLEKGKPKEWQNEVWDNYRRILLRGFKKSNNWSINQALPPDRYGSMYANMELAIAPLQMNDFNDSKCFRKGQEVIMYDGSFSKVEDITIGDRLMGPDSTSREVLSLSSGKGNMVKITPKRGKPFYVTENHILRLKMNDRNSLKRGKPQFIEVSVKDYFKLSKTDRLNYRLYRVGVDFKERNTELHLDPYFVGIMLGDGTLTRGRVGITTMDSEIEESFVENSLCVGGDVKINKNTKKNNLASSFYVYKKQRNRHIPNPVLERFKDIGLKGVSCSDKFIPHEYKISSREKRLELLAGLIDTDGCLSTNKTFYTFSNKSKKLVNDLSFVARSLGLYVSPIKGFKVPKICDTEYYRVQISGNVDIVPCRLARKKANPRKANRDPLTTSFSVEYLGLEQYYGFKVDKDNLHLLDDFIVTHNSEIKVAECGRYKVPLIASNVGCYDETIVNGETGYLIDPDAPRSEWVRILTKCIKNPKHVEVMGRNLRQVTDEYFDINKVVKHRMELYQECFRLLNERHKDATYNKEWTFNGEG